jgi:hypothetical protein
LVVQPAGSPPSLADQLRELVQLKAEGLIDEAEFQIMRKSRLSSSMTSDAAAAAATYDRSPTNWARGSPAEVTTSVRTPRRHGSPRSPKRRSPVYGFQLDDGDRTRPHIDHMFEETASEAIHRWTGHQGEVQGLESKLDQMWQHVEEMRQDQLSPQHDTSAAVYRSPMVSDQPNAELGSDVAHWHKGLQQQYGRHHGTSAGLLPRSTSMVHPHSTVDIRARTFSAPMSSIPPWRQAQPWAKHMAGGARGGDELLPEFTDARRAHQRVWSPVQDALSSGQALPSTLDRELCQMATRGDLDSVKGLLHFGADKDARNSAGAPAAWLAAANGHSAVLMELATVGADVLSRDPSGHTALTVACVNGHADCVSLLLWHGADYEASTKGFTPLMYAAWQGWANCAELLLRAGAEPMRTNSDGHTALDLAQQHRHADVVRLLRVRSGGSSSPVRSGSNGRGGRHAGMSSSKALGRAASPHGILRPVAHVPLVEEGIPPSLRPGIRPYATDATMPRSGSSSRR